MHAEHLRSSLFYSRALSHPFHTPSVSQNNSERGADDDDNSSAPSRTNSSIKSPTLPSFEQRSAGGGGGTSSSAAGEEEGTRPWRSWPDGRRWRPRQWNRQGEEEQNEGAEA